MGQISRRPEPARRGSRGADHRSVSICGQTEPRRVHQRRLRFVQA